MEHLGGHCSINILHAFLTELINNVALVTILVPLVVGIAIGMKIPVLQMVISIILASSGAFIVPVATPSRAIVFTSGHVCVNQMKWVGRVLNLISVKLLCALAYWVVPRLF